MSRKPLTLSDLKERGLVLTKNEATELLPHITEISHRGTDVNHIFCSKDEESPLERDLNSFQEATNTQRIIVVGYDEADQEPKDETLTEDQETKLLEVLGITTDNSPEEYLAALNTYIDGIGDEVPPKLLTKRTQLEEAIAANANELPAGTEGVKEHWRTKAKRLKDAGLMEYTITQEDVDNSKFVGKAGDIIEIPIPKE